MTSRSPVRSWNTWFWVLVAVVVLVESALLAVGVVLASRTVPCYWAAVEVLGWDTAGISCTGAGLAGFVTYTAPALATLVVVASLVSGIVASVRTVVGTRRRVRPVLARTRAPRERLRTLVEEVRPGRSSHVSELAVDEPVCFVHGLLDPRVVISSGLVDDLDPRQLRAVLAHELHHVRVRDPLKVVAARGLTAAAFPFPVLQDLVGHILLRCELNADAVAAAAAGRRTIADTLTRVLFHPRYAVDTAFGAPETARARVARLAGHAPPPLDLSARRLVASVGSVVAIAVAFAGVFAALPATAPAHAVHPGETPPDDLGWSAAPDADPAGRGELGLELQAACAPMYRRLARMPRPDEPPSPDEPPPPVVVDPRGRAAVAAFTRAGRHVFVCHAIRRTPGAWEVVAGAGDALPDGPAPVTAVAPFTSTPPQAAMTSLFGTVRADVDEVLVELADGRRVMAAVADGYYVAWWPSAVPAEHVVARADGRIVGETPAPASSSAVVTAGP